MLGTVRTVLLEPAMGALGAVAVEMPVILGASWLIATWVVRRFAVATRSSAALIGAVALALLWLAELALTLALGGSAVGFLRDLMEPAGILGIAGQVLFGLFPLLIVMRRN